MENIVIGIYKYLWLILWAAAIVGAIIYFIKCIKVCHNGTYSEKAYIGKFYDSGDISFRLTPHKSEIRSISVLVGIYFAVTLSRIAISFLVKCYGANSSLGSIADELVRWDANAYIGISKWGYTGDLNLDRHWHIVFYPLFPFLSKVISLTGIDVVTSSFIEANLCMVMSIAFMYKLIRIDYSDRVAKTAILMMICHPYSFFFAFPFTESTFLLLSILFIYMLRREKWIWAGVCGFFAALTKNFGLIFVIPYGVWLIMLACKEHYNVKKFVLRLLPGFMIFLGFGTYLLINKIVTGGWFTFMEYQRVHWYQEVTCILDNVKLHMSYFIADWTDPSTRWFLWFGNIFFTLILMLSIMLSRKKMMFMYNIYSLAYLFLTMVPSWLLSGSRYVMACFPMYIGYALCTERTRWLSRTIIIIEYIWGIFVLTGYILGAQIM